MILQDEGVSFRIVSPENLRFAKKRVTLWQTTPFFFRPVRSNCIVFAGNKLNADEWEFGGLYARIQKIQEGFVL